jgi:hypothetical protein
MAQIDTNCRVWVNRKGCEEGAKIVEIVFGSTSGGLISTRSMQRGTFCFSRCYKQNTYFGLLSTTRSPYFYVLTNYFNMKLEGKVIE